MEEVGESVAAFAEDAAEDLGGGEHELTVGDFVVMVPDMNGTDLSKIEILVILIINVLRLSDAAKSCLSP